MENKYTWVFRLNFNALTGLGTDGVDDGDIATWYMVIEAATNVPAVQRDGDIVDNNNGEDFTRCIAQIECNANNNIADNNGTSTGYKDADEYSCTGQFLTGGGQFLTGGSQFLTGGSPASTTNATKCEQK